MLIDIRDHYGDVNSDVHGRYQITKLIAGCYAACRQYEKAMSELRRNAHESFNLTRRFTDLCLALGFFQQVVDIMQERMHRYSYIRGRFYTKQFIIAHICLGQLPLAVSRLRQRIKLGSRNQMLINHIWSLRIQTGTLPDALEILATPSAKLRSFGRRNIEAVSYTLNVLLKAYDANAKQSLLVGWSKACGKHTLRSRLNLIPMPSQRNVPSDIITNVEIYNFTNSPSTQSFIQDITRIAEDMTKLAGGPISNSNIGDAELRHILTVAAKRLPEIALVEYELPAGFDMAPFVYDPNYIPSPVNVSRFLALNRLIPEVYSQRHIDPYALNLTARLCKEQIDLSYDMAHFEFRFWKTESERRRKRALSFEIISEEERSIQTVMHRGEIRTETGAHIVSIDSNRNRVWYQKTIEERDMYYVHTDRFVLRRSHVGYVRLAIMLEQQGEFDVALRYVVRAKTEGWHHDWDKRIGRLVKELHRHGAV